MDKLSNFFVNIGKGIKKGFLGLISWVKNTAWIQPLLIVGAIFAVILSIKPVTNFIGGLFDPNETFQFYRNNQANLETVKELYIKDKDGNVKNEGTVIVFFYSESNTTCKNVEKTISNLAFENQDIKWYCINTQLDDIEEDDNGDTKQEKFDRYFINNYQDELARGYNEVILGNADYDGMVCTGFEDDEGVTFGDDPSELDVPTPSMARYDNGELVAYKPSLSSTQTYKDVKNFIKGSAEDWKEFKLD